MKTTQNREDATNLQQNCLYQVPAAYGSYKCLQTEEEFINFKSGMTPTIMIVIVVSVFVFLTISAVCFLIIKGQLKNYYK